VGSRRYARLVPTFGSLYPELPAGHWMPAWIATMQRADRVWLEAGSAALIFARLLPEQHFEFRGGRPRPSGWYVKPERLSDQTSHRSFSSTATVSDQ
jgi:hypothetical protein